MSKRLVEAAKTAPSRSRLRGKWRPSPLAIQRAGERLLLLMLRVRVVVARVGAAKGRIRRIPPRNHVVLHQPLANIFRIAVEDGATELKSESSGLLAVDPFERVFAIAAGAAGRVLKSLDEDGAGEALEGTISWRTVGLNGFGRAPMSGP